MKLRPGVLALLLVSACAPPPAVEPEPVPVATEPGPAEPVRPTISVAPGATPEEIELARPEVPANPLAEQGTFALRQGEALIATEQFTRTAANLEATLSSPQQGRISYSANLTPEATVSRIELRAFPAGAPPGAAPAQSSVAVLRGDSVYVDNMVGDSVQSQQVATTAGAVPYLNPSPSLLEQIVRRARVIGGEQVAVPVFIAGSGGQTVPASVRFLPPDSAVVGLGGTELRLRVDAAGTVLGGSVPAQNLTIERTGVPR